MRQADARPLRGREQEPERGSLRPRAMRDAAAGREIDRIFTQNVIVEMPRRRRFPAAKTSMHCENHRHRSQVRAQDSSLAASDAGFSCARSTHTEEGRQSGGQSGYGSRCNAEKEEGCERGEDEAPTDKSPRPSHGDAPSFSDGQKDLETARDDLVTSTVRLTVRMTDAFR